MNRKNEIPIFFTVDDQYAPFLAVALRSAVKNSSPDRNYRAHIIHQELSVEHMRRLRAIASNNFAIEFIPMSEGFDLIRGSAEEDVNWHNYPLTIYFRLFIPEMFPQYDKGIYIDSDIVVLGDLAELYDSEIGDNYIGACADLSIQECEPLCNYVEQAVGVSHRKYVNSGVLLMNMKKLREVGLERHFLSLLTNHHPDTIAPDQDYLNAMCFGNIFYLSEVWDAMPNDSNPPIEDARLVHYNMFSKPWHYDDVQYGDYFWEYARESGYYSDAMRYRDSFTQESAESDRRSMDMLIERGIELSAADLTFKKLVDRGEKVRL